MPAIWGSTASRLPEASGSMPLSPFSSLAECGLPPVGGPSSAVMWDIRSLTSPGSKVSDVAGESTCSNAIGGWSRSSKRREGRLRRLEFILHQAGLCELLAGRGLI